MLNEFANFTKIWTLHIKPAIWYVIAIIDKLKCYKYYVCIQLRTYVLS